MGRRGRAIALGAALAVVVSMPLVVTISADAGADVLVSKARPATASSTWGTGYAPAKAVDGATRTRWASVGGAGSQWLRIDLGGAQPVSRVRLGWETAYAKAYQVQSSLDGANWTTLYATRAGNGGIDDLRLRGTGRYLRILATQRGTPYGYSLWEVQVYGASSTVAVPALSPGGVTTTPVGLDDPAKKAVAMQLVSSAENSTLNWRAQFGYLEDIGDGRGYTGGIIGFCSGTSDMLALVQEYTRRVPGNVLAKYLPALRRVDGSDSHAGLDPGFPVAWRTAARDARFQKAQEDERDQQYFGPALALAKADGLRALGQFSYYDAAVMHGMSGLRSIRTAALKVAKTPTQRGDEVTWLNAFLDARVTEMATEGAHEDTSRVDTAQRVFLKASNLDLDPPLTWSVYGDRFTIAG